MQRLAKCKTYGNIAKQHTTGEMKKGIKYMITNSVYNFKVSKFENLIKWPQEKKQIIEIILFTSNVKRVHLQFNIF